MQNSVVSIPCCVGRSSVQHVQPAIQSSQSRLRSILNFVQNFAFADGSSLSSKRLRAGMSSSSQSLHSSSPVTSISSERESIRISRESFGVHRALGGTAHTGKEGSRRQALLTNYPPQTIFLHLSVARFLLQAVLLLCCPVPCRLHIYTPRAAVAEETPCSQGTTCR